MIKCLLGAWQPNAGVKKIIKLFCSKRTKEINPQWRCVFIFAFALINPLRNLTKTCHLQWIPNLCLISTFDLYFVICYILAANFVDQFRPFFFFPLSSHTVCSSTFKSFNIFTTFRRLISITSLIKELQLPKAD